MFPVVQHPAEHIAKCLREAQNNEYVFCFEFSDALSDSDVNARAKSYSARLFLEQGRWQLSILEGSGPELETLRAAERIAVDGPWFLKTVSIPKPWGKEIWYSAYEQRGVCHFAASAEQHGIPVPLLLHLFPQLLGRASALNLLKVLAPFSSELLGELYFEMHEEKQEVYVVSHIDEQAWPNGVAEMRFGFCERKQQEFASFEEFKGSYLSSVKAYEAVRQEIDAELRSLSADASVELLSETEKQNMLLALPQALQQREASLARDMSSYIAKRALRLGDVIKVPKMLPHGLLHGVRVVEFQTPVYERLILSFRQQVLTQSHWDTEQALSMLMQAPAFDSKETFDVCPLNEGLAANLEVERIVSFDDFEVYRLRFLKTACVAVAPILEQLLSVQSHFENHPAGNVLMLALHTMTLSGESSTINLQAEEGACLPLWQGLHQNAVNLQAEKGAIALLSRPLP
ncbi:hypothetical protein [Pseudoteredinibacter isoporae]|uniref:Uncharacterized protein YeaO (DUF488 family) n=1 Tax=Pseudoteredinibacter isoporae TaxID=570281 RepID=A0A7X0MXG8_9GAMM|nr:hypothetical protein [Pseudoteredinibacter isoporae]MBB6521989.1 uncharacterized protein YeaO (DUF488 family) [Pseudoteredinibacter isoporae]NHO87525.1 hypothetical protein [Pseudoteredinibacter isoporae]NIB24144.1 hypothetical protein [Pseudoteredinibacter isoporae]